MIKPGFFIIGAPKCGTSALTKYLSGHPAVFMSSVKEPNYFSSDLSERTRMKRDAYQSLFEGADPSRHLAVGEASTTYLFSRHAVPGILEFNPEARFIVMLRNPLDMVQSWHSQKLFEGRETLMDLEEAWRAEVDRRHGHRIPPSCWDAKDLFYSEWAQLGEQMERLLSLVPQERVLAILLEDLISDPAEVYSRTLEFLGLPPDGRRVFEKVNEGKKLIWPHLQRFSGFLAQCAWWVKKRLRITRKFGLISRLLRLNTRVEKRMPIRKAFREELKFFFQKDVDKLSSLLGRDLTHWTSDPRSDET